MCRGLRIEPKMLGARVSDKMCSAAAANAYENCIDENGLSRGNSDQVLDGSERYILRNDSIVWMLAAQFDTTQLTKLRTNMSSLSIPLHSALFRSASTTLCTFFPIRLTAIDFFIRRIKKNIVISTLRSFLLLLSMIFC